MRYKKTIKFLIRFDKNHGTDFMSFCTEDDKQVKRLANELKRNYKNE